MYDGLVEEFPSGVQRKAAEDVVSSVRKGFGNPVRQLLFSCSCRSDQEVSMPIFYFSLRA